MTHRLLFGLRVEHVGPPAEPCTALVVRPGSAGERALARHRLVARPRPDGLDVIAQVDARRHPLVDIHGITLPFELAPRDPDLALRADLEALERHVHPVFHRPHAGSELRPRAGTAPLPPGVLAGVEIAGVTAHWLHEPRQFVIPLPDRQLLWIWYVVTRPRAQAIVVQYADAARSLGFEVDTLSAGPALSAEDTVGAALVARHPDRAVYRVRSDRPVGHGGALRGLSLRFGDHVVLGSLPAPPIHQHTSLRAPGARPRHAIYRVLET